VLASLIGPVPYDLEEVYPATVSAGGVKDFGQDDYALVRPILADRMAAYISANRDHYERYATFTDSRYGQVMADAAELAGVEMAIFPDRRGTRIARFGDSRPRQYWQKYPRNRRLARPSYQEGLPPTPGRSQRCVRVTDEAACPRECGRLA
ncbi:MAG: hypothetical protein ACYS8X_05420, partial [Planctomycetota bacterium]|jgi:hypothetical protein